MTDELVLGIETSGIMCSVAFWSRDRLLMEYNIEQPNVHSELLAVLVHEGLQRLQIIPDDIKLVAVGNGPGSFTGLRIGMSYAKGLAYGLKKPLVPVSNFEILFTHAAGSLFPRMAVIDARRGKVYTAIQTRPGQQDYETGIQSLERIGETQQNMHCIVVEKNVPVEEMLDSMDCVVLKDVRMHAGKICEIAMRKAMNGFKAEMTEIEPLYLQAFAGVL